MFKQYRDDIFVLSFNLKDVSRIVHFNMEFKSLEVQISLHRVIHDWIIQTWRTQQWMGLADFWLMNVFEVF